MKVRVVILNYRGQELLPKCLPSIVEAAAQSVHSVKVALLHNPGGSGDSGLDYVRKNYPQVDIWESPENKVLCSNNDYLPHVSEPVVVLLNNDIRVDEGFIDPLVEKFSNPDTFMTAPKVLNFDGTAIDAARTKAGMKFGLFWCNARYRGYEKDMDLPGETFSSGFGAFSREKFLKLGGYDLRFQPGTWEDVDLSYRARQAGYKLYYEPRSKVYHIGRSSFKKEFGGRQTDVIAWRNTFLFMWKNLRGVSFWIPHLFFLPLRLFAALLLGRLEFIQGFLQALRVQGRKI